jgi:DNA-binding transcriptional LysR family regulator
MTVDEPGVARAVVLAGAGIGYFIAQDVEEDIAAGRLIQLLQDWTPPRPGFSFYYPGRRNPSAGFAAFLEIVREWAATGRWGLAGE